MTYPMISDPGHGCLRVPLSELVDLGIADQISEYSYREGDFAWLEEDCDATRFAVAKGGLIELDHKYVNSTHIRNLPRYTKK